jgi:hypothetical protein
MPIREAGAEIIRFKAWVIGEDCFGFFALREQTENHFD